MNKIQFKFLDIPIIRSCNLSCGGCLTFSDSKKIKGLINLEESCEWLQHWAERLNPEVVTVFGGEPLLHPYFIEWCQELRKHWPNSELRINTNGYYLDRLFDKIDSIFNAQLRPQFIVSIQTGHEPYLSIVNNNIQKAMELVAQRYDSEWELWLDEPEIHKKWYRLYIPVVGAEIRITICEQYNIPWQAHYQHKEERLEPFYEYNDQWYIDNHKYCQAKDFVNLYNGTLYKCPTSAVLNHTLETFQINKKLYWLEYLENYSSLGIDASLDEISAWFKNQKNPEKICNMCGFAGPKYTNGHLNRHELKEGWKYIVINT